MAMKTGNLWFSEEEDEHHVVAAPTDHQKPLKSLRPFIPEIISGGGGGVILSLLQEKHLEHQTLKFSFFLVDDDDVDTTLTLSTAVSRNPTTSPIYNPVLDDDDVDTTLKLSKIVSRNISPPIYDPMPLRCFHPTMLPETSLSAGPSRTNKRGKRKSENDDVVGKKRGKRRINGDGDEDPCPLFNPSIDEFPALARALESRGAVFLYRKKLEDSDVRGDLNRLFVTKREPLMEFLTAEEAAAVDGSAQGLKILGLDQCGKPYSLGLKKWRSLNMTVINCDWNKLAAANGAGKGDAVEIWGFRKDGRLGLAVTFRR